MSYFMYILFSEQLDRYYIGATKDISDRLEKHLWNHKDFTGKAKDWEVRYFEPFNSRSEAFKREEQIKKWKSRKMIELLISSKE